jgi:hypothetical protein
LLPNRPKDDLDALLNQWEVLFGLIEKGDSLSEQDHNLLVALENYELALIQDPDFGPLPDKIEALKGRIDQRFEEYLNAGKRIEAMVGKGYGCIEFRKAEALKPGDEELKELLAGCE